MTRQAFIIGGTGQIGRAIGLKLLTEGWGVTFASRRGNVPDGARSFGAKAICFDREQPGALRQAIAGGADTLTPLSRTLALWRPILSKVRPTMTTIEVIFCVGLAVLVWFIMSRLNNGSSAITRNQAESWRELQRNIKGNYVKSSSDNRKIPED